MATILSNAGRAIMTNLLGALNAQAAPNYIGIGSGAGTAAVADTTLFTEYTTGTWAGYARATAAPTRSTTSVANDTVQWQGTFTAGATQTVTNAANFDAATVGGLYIKGDFAGIPLSAGDSIQLTIKHQMN